LGERCETLYPKQKQAIQRVLKAQTRAARAKTADLGIFGAILGHSEWTIHICDFFAPKQAQKSSVNFGKSLN